jgi:hypothetical protein
MNENHHQKSVTGEYLLTRRRAIQLCGAALVPFAIPKSGVRVGALSADEAFRIIEKWNGGALSTKEIERVFLDTWPTMHRHGYNILKIPCGRKLPQFFDSRKMMKLLQVVKARGATDLLYIALESPLRLTHHGVVGGPEWNCYVAWLKRSLVSCARWPGDLQIARKAISLSELLSFLPKP